jgi:hypothetical protein
MTKWIRTSTAHTNKRVYHTDKDCVMLAEKREASESEIEFHDLRECKYCSSDKDPRPNTDQDRGYYQALQEAARNNE